MLNFLDPYKRQKKAILELKSNLSLDDNAKEIIQEYIDANEFGIAFEQIVYEINENEIKITSSTYDQINQLAQLMMIPDDNYKFLQIFIH